MEAQLDSNAFQEIMDDFVEVHKAASQEVDIGLMLADVKIAIQAGEKKYKDFLKSFMVTCENAQAKVSGFVKSLTHASDDAKNKINKLWTPQLEKGRKGIKEAQANAKATAARIEDIGKQMEKIVIDYQAGVAETDRKLVVVKQLRDIIEDELINPTPSFIQIGKFNEKLKVLEDLIKKSGDTLYTPMIEALVQLASQQNFSDQKILQAILKNLNNLEASLKKFRTEKEHDMKEGLQSLKAQEENLVSQLEDYHHLEQRAVSDVAEANQNIALLNTEVLNLATEITRKNDEFKTIVHLCETENGMFKAGVKRIGLIKKDLSVAQGHELKLHS